MAEAPPESREINEEQGIWDYSPEQIAALASELDRLSANAADPWDLLQRLTAAHRGEDGVAERNALLVMTERALAYSFCDDDARYGSSNIGQRFSSANGDWPPAFDVVRVQEKACWVDLARRVTHVLPKTHFSDLSLAAGLATGLPAAESIVMGYLQLASISDVDAYYRASSLRRAWTLARQFSLLVESLVRGALYEMAQSVSSINGAPAGVLFQCLEPLAVSPRSGQFTDPDKGEVIALVDAIEIRHGKSDFLLESIHGVREQLAETDTERASARRTLVQGYLDIANESEGLRRLTWLQRAASEAQRLAIHDLRGTAVTAMQEMSVDDLGMQSVATEHVLPRHSIDWRISRYRWSRSALDALDIWLTTTAPTGSYQANVRQATEISGRGILQLVSRITVDGDGMPIRSSVGPEAAEVEWLERLEDINAAAQGIALTHELSAIKTEYGVTSLEDIAAHLATRYQCDIEQARALGEAFVSYWQGRYADAARAAYPLVEAGARGLLLALGEPLFRIETGRSAGRFPALETYAERLEALEFDIDWLRTLRNPVARLRNSIAHGHNLRPSDVDAVILLRMAGLLVVLAPSSSSDADRSSVGARLRDPLGYVALRMTVRRRARVVWAKRAPRGKTRRHRLSTRPR